MYNLGRVWKGVQGYAVLVLCHCCNEANLVLKSWLLR